MKKRKKIAKPLGLLVIILVGVIGAFVMSRSDTPNMGSEQPVAVAAQNTTQTYDATSEGSTFPVPETVPKSSIKNYTLITENEQFKIRKDGNNYLITLYAVINRPDQYEAYKEQLREYKQNALQFLTDQGLHVETLDINYEPEEATQL